MFILRKHYTAFTLAELLISLLILAAIATFSIPKILMSAENQQKKAVFRETIAALSQAIYMGSLEGSLTKNTSLAPYLSSKLNAVKLCPNNASTEGCWANTSWVGEENEAGFILHNGVSIAGIRASTGDGFDNILMDWNGSQEPNMEGEDRIFFTLCWDRSATGTYATNCSRPSQQGYVEIGNNAYPASRNLWAWIFSKFYSN